MIITIDGPAGSGKSTTAKRLAERLGFERLDTGAMYRAVGWYCLQNGVPLHQRDAVAEAASRMELRTEDGNWFVGDADSGEVDVTESIRSAEVAEAASRVATNPAVRERLVELQRQAAEGRNIVTEGRDQGTVVFPAAEVKFFLRATVDVRAARRKADYDARGRHVTLEDLVKQIEERDKRDAERKESPLKAADDAHWIDTSERTIEEVLDELEGIVNETVAGLSDGSDAVFLEDITDDPEMLAATRQARTLLPVFQSLLDAYGRQKDAVCSVKLALLPPGSEDAEEDSAEDDESLRLWVTRVHAVEDGLPHETHAGIVFELPDGVDWLEVGETVTFDLADAEDWMVLHEGHLHGGFTLRVIRDRLDAASHAEYDNFLGVTQYVPLPPA